MLMNRSNVTFQCLGTTDYLYCIRVRGRNHKDFSKNVKAGQIKPKLSFKLSQMKNDDFVFGLGEQTLSNKWVSETAHQTKWDRTG